jgi:hypothetical protein
MLKIIQLKTKIIVDNIMCKVIDFNESIYELYKRHPKLLDNIDY